MPGVAAVDAGPARIPRRACRRRWWADEAGWCAGCPACRRRCRAGPPPRQPCGQYEAAAHGAGKWAFLEAHLPGGAGARRGGHSRGKPTKESPRQGGRCDEKCRAPGGPYRPSGWPGRDGVRSAGCRYFPFVEEEHQVWRASVNQLSRLYTRIDWQPGSRNFDLGCGRFELATRYLAARGVENVRIDPFNRSPAENRAALRALREFPADTCTLANVLHVIADPRRRARVLARAARCLRPGGVVYVSVCWRGLRRRRGVSAIGSYVEERPLSWYLSEVSEWFPGARLAPDFIWAVRRPTLPPPSATGKAWWDPRGDLAGHRFHSRFG